MTVDQIAIAVTGLTAVFLTQSENERFRRFACLFGVLGQPFWFYTSYASKQWGVFLMCFFYTWAWMMGVWLHWIRPTRKRRDS